MSIGASARLDWAFCTLALLPQSFARKRERERERERKREREGERVIEKEKEREWERERGWEVNTDRPAVKLHNYDQASSAFGAPQIAAAYYICRPSLAAVFKNGAAVNSSKFP